MLVRLLLALLLAFGAMPAAPCHAAASVAAHDCHRPAAPARQDHGVPAEHGCIGCAALDDWLADRVAPPAIAATAGHAAWRPSFVTGAGPPPMLRPPQAG